ncbi:hypothetical protein H0H93_012350 [Arthromyces matolae]|nr:hypothetical protein H0H93_012350 [Arthromyces matolae]
MFRNSLGLDAKLLERTCVCLWTKSQKVVVSRPLKYHHWNGLIGSFNKIFRMRFDNSKTIIARLPSSRMFGSGTSNIISSEVATMSLASKSGIRTPRVLSWRKDCDNPVGWPYILMEDIDGTTLSREWPQPETRGEPVATFLTQVASSMQKMMSSNFSRIGSPYFLQDLPDSALNLPPPATDFEIENGVRVGPIADFLWWRCYHDEPHFDRGPWNTIEEYLKAAVCLERRAVERHRQDPSSLAYTKSSIEDLDEVEYLLNKVEEIAPHMQHVIEHASPTTTTMPKRLMQICFMHPDLLTQNIMVPTLTADNSNRLTRMLDPVFIDWQGTCALPLAMQWHTPPFVRYEARLFDVETGRPVLRMWYPFKEIALPKDFDQLDPEFQDMIREEHEIATRHVRWNQWFNKHAAEFAAPLISFRIWEIN